MIGKACDHFGITISILPSEKNIYTYICRVQTVYYILSNLSIKTLLWKTKRGSLEARYLQGNLFYR